MGADITLFSEGHLPYEEMKGALEAAGIGPVRIELPDTSRGLRLASLHFPDPEDASDPRRMSVMHTSGPDPEECPNIVGDECTYCSLSAQDGGPRAMRVLAEAFGGRLHNEDTGDVEDFPRRGVAPLP